MSEKKLVYAYDGQIAALETALKDAEAENKVLHEQVDSMHKNTQNIVAALNTKLKDAEEKADHYQEFTDRYRKESLRLTDELAASEKREAGLREDLDSLFDAVDDLIYNTRQNGLDGYKDSNGLNLEHELGVRQAFYQIASRKKALKEPAEDGDEIQNQDQAARSHTG